jgi:hypothetical protein
MTQKKKDTGTPNPGKNDSGVGGQYDPHYDMGSEQSTKPGGSKINNPSKETKDETEKAKLKDEKDNS